MPPGCTMPEADNKFQYSMFNNQLTIIAIRRLFEVYMRRDEALPRLYFQEHTCQ